MGDGGGWMPVGFEPIFTVTDVPRATDHYAKMGFEISHHDETRPTPSPTTIET